MSDASVPTLLVSELVREDPEMRDIVEDFVSDLQIRIGELRTAFTSRDWEALTRLAHQLKGAGGSYGYPAISELGASMETDFRRQNDRNFGTQLEALAALAAAAGAALQ